MIENGLGFMGFWSDIESDYLLTYQEWHNCEHMPERVAIPGFIEGRRYRGGATPTGASFFMCYVTDTPDVLGGAAYLAALERPTPWTREALTHFRNPSRTLYRRLSSVGSAPLHRPYLGLLRFDHELGPDELTALLPDVVQRQRGLVVSLFEVNAAASGIMTAERKIYSGGPSKQRFLIAVEGPEHGSVETLLKAVTAALGSRIRNAESWTYWQEARIRASDVDQSVPLGEEAVA